MLFILPRGSLSVPHPQLQLRVNKFKAAHFDLTNWSKMRVSLAAQIFSRSMLQLIDDGRRLGFVSANLLGSWAELIANMDRLFDIFNTRRDKDQTRKQSRPIASPDDPQIGELVGILRWFVDWRRGCVACGAEPADCSHFLASAAWSDLKHMIVGTTALSCWFTCGHADRELVLRRVSQDIIENHFCNQRQAAGATSSVTAATAKAGTNSSVAHRLFVGKSNAAGAPDTGVSLAEPMNVDQLKRKRSALELQPV